MITEKKNIVVFIKYFGVKNLKLKKKEMKNK